MTPHHNGAPFGIGVFAALDDSSASFCGLVRDDLVAPLPGVSFGSLFDDWERSVRELSAVADDATTWQASVPLAELRPLAPLAGCPALFLAGANYRQHVIELMLAEPEMSARADLSDEQRHAIAAEAIDKRAAEGTPYVFLGLSRAMSGAYDPIVLPERGERHDWELELAVVIGRTARNVRREDALGYVAGYTVCNDITTRDLVFRPDVTSIGTDWLRSKNAPGFYPIGPYVVPAAFIGDPMDLRLTLRLNGEVMQDASTGGMVFDIARLIEYVSSTTEMRPGDVLLTGSPPGNGAHWGRLLQPGDEMEGTIEGLGTIRNRCVVS